jgi:uncharacterized protein (TIGR00266 family)
MQYQILYPGSSALLAVKLDAGERIKAEAGAMVAKTTNVISEATIDGGIGKATKRLIFGGEEFFFQHLYAEGGPGEVLLAPYALGDIKLIELSDGLDLYLQPGAFMACLGDVTIETNIQQVTQGLFSNEGFFVLRATGEGIVAFSSFGAVLPVEVGAGQEYVIDNGHVVAWSGDASYTIDKGGKDWFSTFASGEGLVCRFAGPGTVYLQSRNPKSFGEWFKKYSPSPKANLLKSDLGD